MIQPRYFSDFGGLRIKESGLRLGDEIVIRPFNGNRQKIVLNKTSYKIRRGEKLTYEVEKSEIKIPLTSNVFTEYELILCPKDPKREIDERGRFLLRATGLNPFKLNGNYSFESFLEYGDIVELEYTRLEVSRPITAEKGRSLPLPQRLIESELSVLIEGETGTGKSTLAKEIHESSGRMGAFVQINISSYSSTLLESELFGHIKGAFTGAINSKRGAFAEAHKGTLFIDEIDSLPKSIQTKLLLFLDHKKVRPVGSEVDQQLDVRLIFSSGQSLQNLVDLDSMRKDFYYRLSSGGHIFLSPLRNSRDKITDILNDFEKEKGVFVVPELKRFYNQFSWPGNIRQLVGHLNQKVVLTGGEKLSFCDLDERLSRLEIETEMNCMETEFKTLDEIKTLYVLKTFEKLERNVKKTARVLKISPNTVRNLVR